MRMPVINTKRLIEWLLPVLFLYSPPVRGQQIHYSVPLGDNARSTSFQILGKCGRAFLIYKSDGRDHDICFYDETMQLTGKQVLDFLPRNLLAIDFVAYPHQLLAFYQYRRKRTVVCEARILDASGTPLGKPVLIDETTDNVSLTEEQPYVLLVSKDKSHLLVYQLRKVEDSSMYHLAAFLYDSTLSSVYKKLVTLQSSELSDDPSFFKLGNEGDLFFTVGMREHALDAGQDHVWLYHLGPGKAGSKRYACRLNGYASALSQLIETDEQRHCVWLLAWLYDEKQRNIDSLYCLRYDYRRDAMVSESVSLLDDSLKQAMKGKDYTLRQAFDNTVLKDLVVDKNGNGLLVTEDVHRNVKGKIVSGDLALLELDTAGHLLKGTPVPKYQGDDLLPDLMSYLMINTGGSLHFLFNRQYPVARFLSGYIYLVSDYLYKANGSLEELPLYRNLNKRYNWVPRDGVQVSSREAIVPCIQGSTLFFAKVTY